MIQISKNEARLIREAFPALHIKRTVNRYYIEERPQVLAFLKRISHSKAVSAHC